MYKKFSQKREKLEKIKKENYPIKLNKKNFSGDEIYVYPKQIVKKWEKEKGFSKMPKEIREKYTHMKKGK
ncbi:MAG: hypothetical protein RMI30_07230 [Thermodesulfovibrio sp.]|nr:hypothetical protein [Thermodesulfovibrio sp.]MDW7999215.1 hypothetical protein [Thermodesulfovibrio sp.]